ncbi:MAG: hypothetical protein WDM91_16485 [Rhizomicrobium sp.]
MLFKHLALSAAIVVLAGCVSPSTYHPAQSDRGTGYSDQRLAENRYRVTFTGNSQTRRDVVENYLLLRAAEVTRDAGYGWFAFDNRDTEAKTTYHTDFAGYPGWGPGWGPGFGWYRHSWRYDPWDPFWQNTTFPTTRYEAYAEIVLLTPEQAHQDPHALQASDVIARLGPAAVPPPPAP